MYRLVGSEGSFAVLILLPKTGPNGSFILFYFTLYLSHHWLFRRPPPLPPQPARRANRGHTGGSGKEVNGLTETVWRSETRSQKRHKGTIGTLTGWSFGPFRHEYRFQQQCYSSFNPIHLMPTLCTYHASGPLDLTYFWIAHGRGRCTSSAFSFSNKPRLGNCDTFSFSDVEHGGTA